MNWHVKSLTIWLNLDFKYKIWRRGLNLKNYLFLLSIIYIAKQHVLVGAILFMNIEIAILNIQSNLPKQSPVLKGHLFSFPVVGNFHMNWYCFKSSSAFKDNFFLCPNGDLLLHVWLYYLLYRYRITAVIRVETDIIFSTTSSPIVRNLQNGHYCFLTVMSSAIDVTLTKLVIYTYNIRRSGQWIMSILITDNIHTLYSYK